ncbi:MAG: corrinoid protein [bacterium]
MEETFVELRGKVIRGDRDGARAIVDSLLEKGTDAQKIIGTSLIPAMDTVGEKFEKNEFFLPELLVAARAMENCMEVLQPLLVKGGVKPLATAVIGTVKGDLHDIGKNIVAAMLKGAGFEIIDLGKDVAPEKFAAEIKSRKPSLVGMSALLTTTMRAMKDTIEVIGKKGLRGDVKILVGGAPLTESYAADIGADGYAPDAAQAVRKARELLGIAQ